MRHIADGRNVTATQLVDPNADRANTVWEGSRSPETNHDAIYKSSSATRSVWFVDDTKVFHSG